MDNPFPSLLLGVEEEDAAEEDALLQLTGQEEAMLPGESCANICVVALSAVC